MNVFELLFFVANVAIGIVVASWASRRFGWFGGVIGFVGGFAVIPTICHFVFRTDRRLLRDGSKGSPPDGDRRD
jgi:ABC-type cobalamin transport system permease subunit